MPRTAARREIYMRNDLLKLMDEKMSYSRRFDPPGKKKTVATLAKELGISTTAMSHKKNGITEITLAEAIKIFDFLSFTDKEILSITKK